MSVQARWQHEAILPLLGHGVQAGSYHVEVSRAVVAATLITLRRPGPHEVELRSSAQPVTLPSHVLALDREWSTPLVAEADIGHSFAFDTVAVTHTRHHTKATHQMLFCYPAAHCHLQSTGASDQTQYLIC